MSEKILMMETSTESHSRALLLLPNSLPISGTRIITASRIRKSGSDQPMKLITMKRTPHRTHRKPASRWVRFQFSSLLRVQGSRMPMV